MQDGAHAILQSEWNQHAEGALNAMLHDLARDSGLYRRAPSPRAFENRRISDFDVTRARMVHREWYAFKFAIGVMMGGASLRATAELLDLQELYE